jgi:hypothetical protein
MMWVCRNHGLECKSYMEHDLKLLNDEKVKPDEIKGWYLKKFPLMGLADAKEYERIVNKVLEWQG